MKKSFALIFLSLALGIAAHAPVHASGAGEGYLLLSLGNADADFRTSPSDAVQGDDTAFEIGVGYAISQYLAVEASYQNFGDPNGFAGCPPDVLCIAIVPFAREPVSVDGWSAALRGAVPVTDSLSIFGKIGFLAWDSSARNSGLNDSGTDFLYGVGIASELSDRLGLQLSWERADTEIETVKLGLRIGF